MGTVKKKLKIGGASDNHTIQNRLFREEELTILTWLDEGGTYMMDGKIDTEEIDDDGERGEREEQADVTTSTAFGPEYRNMKQIIMKYLI